MLLDLVEDTVSMPEGGSNPRSMDCASERRGLGQKAWWDLATSLPKRVRWDNSDAVWVSLHVQSAETRKRSKFRANCMNRKITKVVRGDRW